MYYLSTCINIYYFILTYCGLAYALELYTYLVHNMHRHSIILKWTWRLQLYLWSEWDVLSNVVFTRPSRYYNDNINNNNNIVTVINDGAIRNFCFNFGFWILLRIPTNYVNVIPKQMFEPRPGKHPGNSNIFSNEDKI